MHCPKNMEMQEEKAIGSVEIKLKRHLVIDFCLIRGIRGNFGVIVIVV